MLEVSFDIICSQYIFNILFHIHLHFCINPKTHNTHVLIKYNLIRFLSFLISSFGKTATDEQNIIFSFPLS